MREEKKILITAALPYANGPLHFGHIAGAYLPADSYARFQRLLKNDVLFICGSDEYGVAITYSADLAGKTPKQQVDLYHGINSNFFKQLNISFDHYSRTTWEGHKALVQEFFLQLLKNGHIEEKVTEQLYSPADKKFLADRYVEGICPRCGFEKARGDECPKCGASYDAMDLKNPRSKLTGATLEKKPTKHWFMRFDHFKTELSSWIKTKDWKSSVVHFVQHYIDELKERPITRDSTWGIPVPLEGAEGKVLYVWFDAPIGYISATQEWAIKNGDPQSWKKYWLDEKTTYVQFIGKDNIPFHAIFFPAMIMGQDVPYKLVDELPANEFYHLEGKQFSKTSGWYIDLDTFFKKFTADQIRYTIAANAPETQDAEFSWRDFQARCNSELLGKYGNFAHRVLTFTRKHFDGKIPAFEDPSDEDLSFIENIKKFIDESQTAFSSFHLRRASQLIMELATLGNVYFDKKTPWKAIKDEKKKKDVGNTMAACLRCIQALALISYPIIPESAEKLWGFLGFISPLEKSSFQEISKLSLKEGTLLPMPEILFIRVEDTMIHEEIEKLGKRVEKEGKSEVSFQDFEKLDLRVAEILSAEPIPKSDKLLKIIVDLAGEKRTVVSGIAKRYKSEELVGKKVILLANLKPAKLMGIESQGMILAAGEGDELELIAALSSRSGAVVK